MYFIFQDRHAKKLLTYTDHMLFVSAGIFNFDQVPETLFATGLETVYFDIIKRYKMLHKLC